MRKKGGFDGASLASSIQMLIDGLIERTGQLMSWLVALLLLNVVAVVLSRYVFNISITVMQESIIYLHATIFMLGACYAFKEDAHVSIDFINARLPVLWRLRIKIIGNLLLLMPFGMALLWFSTDYVAYSWSLREHSAESDGLPAVFLLKSMIPLLGLSMLLAGVSDTIRQFELLKKERS
jgi:TRAP-type mannitol/chloroaromatic compound transport system permease small subunit